MKLRFIALILLTAVIFCTGCTEKQRQDISHWKSDLIGLKRKITLYSDDGKPIKTWEGRYKVEISGCAVRFIHDGRAVILSGTYIVEEQ